MSDKKSDADEIKQWFMGCFGMVLILVIVVGVVQVVSWFDGDDDQPAEQAAKTERVEKQQATTKAPPTTTSTAPATESRASQDERAVANFNRYVRRRGPDLPWDDLLADVYITGMLNSTLNVEFRDTTAAAEALCVLIEQWIIGEGGRWVSRAKVRRPVDRGHAVLAEC